MYSSFSRYIESPGPNTKEMAPSQVPRYIYNLWRSYKYMILSTVAVFILLNLSLGDPSTSVRKRYSLSDFYPQSFFGNATLIKTPPPRKNVHDMYTIEARLAHYFPYNSEGEIENNIWQMWQQRPDDKKFPVNCFPHIQRWRLVNDDYNHNLILTSEGESLVSDYLKDQVPEVLDALLKLPDARLKYEFLKYLIVYIGGGLFADIDTICAKPMKYWYESRIIPGKLMVGISTDYNDENWTLLYNRRLSFSNKLFRAKSHHPFLAKLIARITYMVHNDDRITHEIDWNTAFENLDSNGEPLTQCTGESVFTDTLFEYLNELESPFIYRVARTDKDLLPEKIVGPETQDKISYKLLSLAVGPTQVDDVIIMPEITFKGSKEFESHNSKSMKQDFTAEYDDENKREGNEKLYYARPLNILTWDDFDESY
ncbi:hypothetical protein KL933_002721 [Ogataea haglerorum]|uniref:Initiation-specific alpha-1,6-mannosyltransferase n=1 Tax=Ogataea haglerorum TaxID=1937702 RepID=A0AAN6D518_9ASCO|nr:hypothetical protein KL951_002245 [Ogataea haglerorum]KAG7709230.1 hypothetical protein KL914_001620 [Ogataea haglerorum]KAG7717906.1 hypothetical protein KL913_002842 [Ogataea haglerorum]KAG7718208.1 hypothetical protein KL949_003180 [Ogataea haglerorum]KAG7727012.1 hypothetical protein KL933_002721 [Ogataea haglerorum]